MNAVRDTTRCKNTRPQPLRGKAMPRGFTLLEILIAVAVVGILLAIALPSYSAALGRADCNTLLTALMGSITDARGAAQNYESDAILCPSDDGASCSGKAQWQNGWIVGVDGNGDNSISGGESVVSHQPDFEENVHMVTSSGRTRLQFQPYGSNAGSNVTFTLCDRRGESGSSAYVLNNSGHFHEARPTAQNTAAACAGM